MLKSEGSSRCISVLPFPSPETFLDVHCGNMVKLLEVNITIMQGPIELGSAGVFDLSTLSLQRFTNDSSDFPTWHWCLGQSQLSVSAPGSTTPCICLLVSLNSLNSSLAYLLPFCGSKELFIFARQLTCSVSSPGQDGDHLNAEALFSNNIFLNKSS